MRLILIILAFLWFCPAQAQDTSRLWSFIQEWWEVPYKFGGASKSGIDCSKYTQRLYKQVFGLNIPGVSWKQWQATERVDIDSLTMGDLVFFRSKLSPSGWHVGVYLWSSLFVHSANRKEDMEITSLNEEQYRKNFRGGGRIKKVN